MSRKESEIRSTFAGSFSQEYLGSLDHFLEFPICHYVSYLQTLKTSNRDQKKMIQ